MEDYKEKYDKLVEAIKALQELNPSDGGIQNWVNDNVPELAESEGEKIRKVLIDLVKCNERSGYKLLNNMPTSSMIAWLEKQGEQKPVDKEYTFKSIPRLLDMIEPSEKAKYYCQKLIDTLTKEGYNTDVKIVGECLKRMNDEKVGMATMDEKEQSPKFKVGDWIAHNTNNTVYHIDDVADGRYYLTSSNGSKTYNSIRIVDDHAHLWTIKDAKPGDILASNKNIFIFKEIYMAGKPCGYCGVWNDFFIDDYDGCWTNEQCYPATEEQRKLLFEKMTEAGYEWEKEVLNKIKMQDLATSETNVTKISDQDKWNNEDIRMLNTVINIFEKVYPSNYFTTFVTGSDNPTLINSPEIVKWLKRIKQQINKLIK